MAEGDDVRELTVLFIDLAGFTALTEAHGDNHAADLAIRFSEFVDQELATSDRLVKTIGDAVLVVSAGPSSGLALGARILERIEQEPNFPIPRTAIHHGPVVERRGDVFGATVNLTARIAAQAYGGQVLGTDVIAEQARRQGVDVVDLGGFVLKNVASEVELFEIHIGPRVRGAVVDPVCRMRVERDDAVGRLRVDGVDHWFCSLECASKFLRAAAAD